MDFSVIVFKFLDYIGWNVLFAGEIGFRDSLVLHSSRCASILSGSDSFFDHFTRFFIP